MVTHCFCDTTLSNKQIVKTVSRTNHSILPHRLHKSTITAQTNIQTQLHKIMVTSTKGRTSSRQSPSQHDPNSQKQHRKHSTRFTPKAKNINSHCSWVYSLSSCDYIIDVTPSAHSYKVQCIALYELDRIIKMR